MSFSSPQSFSADGRAGGRTRTDMLVYNCGLEAEKKSFVHSRMGRRAADRPLFRPPAPASAARPSPFSAVLNFIPSFAPPNLPAGRPRPPPPRSLAALHRRPRPGEAILVAIVSKTAPVFEVRTPRSGVESCHAAQSPFYSF